MGAIDDGRDRHGRGAVPVPVEYPRQVADDGPDRQHVQIAKIGDGVHAVIDVADVAAADDRRRIVGDHQLVVHAAVDPAEVDKEVESGPAPVGERVEQADLDIGVGVEGGYDGIAGLVVGIVDEQPHPDPAIGRPHHAVDDDPAGRIAVPDVVLHVEASLGQVGQRQTDDEGLAPLAQEAEAGEARMLVGRRAEELAQPGRRGVLERRRHRARMVGPGAGGTAGEDPGEPDQDRAREPATGGRYLRLGRTRGAAGPSRVGAHGTLRSATAGGRAWRRRSARTPNRRRSPRAVAVAELPDRPEVRLSTGPARRGPHASRPRPQSSSYPGRHQLQVVPRSICLAVEKRKRTPHLHGNASESAVATRMPALPFLISRDVFRKCVTVSTN